jgi:hypothetical protein
MVRLSVSLASRAHSRAWLMHSLLEANGACSHPEMNAGAASQQQGHRNQVFHISFSSGCFLTTTTSIAVAPFRSHLINIRPNKSGVAPQMGRRTARNHLNLRRPALDLAGERNKAAWATGPSNGVGWDSGPGVGSWAAWLIRLAHLHAAPFHYERPEVGRWRAQFIFRPRAMSPSKP